jgi:hypothetical protein
MKSSLPHPFRQDAPNKPKTYIFNDLFVKTSLLTHKQLHV